MSDSIADTSEAEEMTEVDLDGLEQVDSPTPGQEDTGENGKSIVDFLKSKGPGKNLQEYEGHALDFDGNESTRRIIRGVEGLLGEANYAVADIVIGFAQKLSDLTGEADDSGGVQGDPFEGQFE